MPVERLYGKLHDAAGPFLPSVLPHPVVLDHEPAAKRRSNGKRSAFIGIALQAVGAAKLGCAVRDLLPIGWP